jgi:SNF2 family DNA or RNA helicase
MSLTKILKLNCPTCNKPLVEKSRTALFGLTNLITYECGHFFTEDKIASAPAFQYDIVSKTKGFKLRPYQIDAVKFLEEANGRALIADEQGLGKTIEVTALFQLHPSECYPAIIVTKTGIKHQWWHEQIEWNGEVAQVISSGKERAFPGFNVYIISYDLLKIEDMFSLIFTPLKTIVLDECQSIKNLDADRTKAVQKIVKQRNIPHVIGLSGTPIKNNAGEYFPILNLLNPTRFRTYKHFLDKYCDAYWGMYGAKVGGLKDAELFHEDTKDIVLRRLRKEVAPEIPDVDRQFFHVELDPKLNPAYAALLDELEELMYGDAETGLPAMNSKIAIMTKLRRITGISKVKECVEYVEMFFENNPDRKLAIFVHHHDVRNLLKIQLEKLLVAHKGKLGTSLTFINAGDNGSQIAREFETSDSRILIASELAAGEGLNLQYMSDCIMLERQWNPANEEQAEGRFARLGQKNNIIAQYFIATGTIDEYFTELVESKRSIMKSMLDKESYQWDQNSLMSELANILITKGRSKWRL